MTRAAGNCLINHPSNLRSETQQDARTVRLKHEGYYFIIIILLLLSVNSLQPENNKLKVNSARIKPTDAFRVVEEVFLFITFLNVGRENNFPP